MRSPTQGARDHSSGHAGFVPHGRAPCCGTVSCVKSGQRYSLAVTDSGIWETTRLRCPRILTRRGSACMAGSRSRPAPAGCQKVGQRPYVVEQKRYEPEQDADRVFSAGGPRPHLLIDLGVLDAPAPPVELGHTCGSPPIQSMLMVVSNTWCCLTWTSLSCSSAGLLASGVTRTLFLQHSHYRITSVYEVFLPAQLVMIRVDMTSAFRLRTVL